MLFFPITQLPLVQLELQNVTQPLHQHCFFTTLQANRVAFSQHLDQVCRGAAVMTLKGTLNGTRAPLISMSAAWCSLDHMF